jgi:hypothetical protein
MGKKLMTKELCLKLDVPYHVLYGRMRSGVLEPPERDSGGRMWWSADDVKRARKGLVVDKRRREHRRAKDASVQAD